MLPKNMGRRHRLAYLIIGIAAIGGALAIADLDRIIRLSLALIGLSALGSSATGYCVSCHTLGLSTKDDRIHRVP